MALQPEQVGSRDLRLSLSSCHFGQMTYTLYVKLSMFATRISIPGLLTYIHCFGDYMRSCLRKHFVNLNAVFKCELLFVLMLSFLLYQKYIAFVCRRSAICWEYRQNTSFLPSTFAQLGLGRQINSHYSPISSVLCQIPQGRARGAWRGQSREPEASGWASGSR